MGWTLTLLSKQHHGRTVADIAPFRAAVKDVHEQFKKSIGSELLDEALAAVK
jgi:hypothetical protein